MNNIPQIITELPGPKAQALIEADEKVVSPSLPRAYPLVAESARGCVVTDVDGNRFLDFAAGIAVCSTGHCHPRVVKAIQDQAARLIHLCGADFYYPVYAQLAEKLASLAPGPGDWQVFLSNSGAEAVEGALKLARYATGRHRFIAFLGAFHGRTLGTMSLTASKPKYRRHFGPLLSGVTHVPYGNCFNCHFNLDYPECGLACVDYIEREIFARIAPPEDVAAIIVEPVQGEGGYVIPPPDWLLALRALCDRHGILLIADEIQSGMGRTGKMFAVEHFGVVPDIITVAKGIASGMPVGAFIARSELMTWAKGAHGSTFGGNPVACAAALETIALLEEELMENAARVGAYLLDRLATLRNEHPIVAAVRGLGLMIGIEFQTGEQSVAVAKGCFRRGLIVLGCGDKAIRLSPPLVVSREEVDVALQVFE
ncbi:MAG: acetyl ornithine aminotransferase family protein, partial [Chloroflexi bacterium]|nr:acetyl ornithine aminotransferase family protein [Chloroflexota bacterium]